MPLSPAANARILARWKANAAIGLAHKPNPPRVGKLAKDKFDLALQRAVEKESGR